MWKTESILELTGRLVQFSNNDESNPKSDVKIPLFENELEVKQPVVESDN